jgi:hypothetical protein
MKMCSREYERTFIKSKANFCSIGDPPNKPTIGDKIKPLGNQKVRPENE